MDGCDSLERTRRETIAWCLLSVGVVFGGVVVGAFLVWLLGIPSGSLWRSIVPEASAAIATILCVVLLGGKRLFAPSRDDMDTVLRLGWWDILMTFGLMMMLVIIWRIDGEGLPANWPLRLAETVLFCLCVGLFEEALFRGLVFQGLLAWLGGTHRGVVRAAVMTSIAFGLMHVVYGVATIDALTLLQALLKVVQTGMYSFLLCVIVLRSRRLGGASLLHAYDDLLVMIPDIVLYGGTFDVEYVSTGEDAPYAIALYLTVIAFSLPFVMMAARELKRGRYVTYGVFVERGPLAPGAAPIPPALPPAPVTIPDIVEGPVSAPATHRGGTEPGSSPMPTHKPPPPKGFR